MRWHECDELAHDDPIGALLCRTSKLNDHAHETDKQLALINRHVWWFGLATTGLGVLSGLITLVKTIHG
jgi:hypothetical protein